MQIIHTNTQVTAQEDVQNVTVMYSYNYENQDNPTVISFSATRQQDSYPYLQGSVAAYDFNVQNSNFQPSDIELYKQIQERCTAIINGTEKIDKPKNKQ